MLRIKNNKVKMFLGMLASVVSICALTNGAFATVEPQCKKTDIEDYTIYQFTIEDNNWGETTAYTAITACYGEGDSVDLTADDKLVWREEKVLMDEETGKYKMTALAVLKVANEDGSSNPLSAIQLKIGEDVRETLAITGVGALVFSECNEYDETTESTGYPKIDWVYKNLTDEKYVQFSVSSLSKISRVVDVDGNDRVRIREKNQGEELVARYDFTDSELDSKFYVCDLLGNTREISIGDIPVSYTIAAKDIDGQTVVLNMVLPEGATLQSIKPVGGEDIVADAADGSKSTTLESKHIEDDGVNPPVEDKLIGRYTHVSEGTTFVDVTYRPEGGNANGDDDVTIRVELDLDIKAPIIVKRDTVGNGSITEAVTGTLRAYKNADGDKAIVEVKDMVSGIAKIVACTGTEPIVESTTENQVFDIKELPKSVVQLIELPADATYIRVYDGIGNIKDINIETEVAEDADSTALSIVLEKEGIGEDTVVTATFRDKKAGIEKFVKAKAEDAEDAEVTDDDETDPLNVIPGTKTTDGNVSYVKDDTKPYDTLQTTADISNYYKVTETTTTLTGRQLQGVPEYTLVDAFDNTKEATLNDVLFDKKFVYVDNNATGNSSAIAVKVHDDRRIKKITTTVDNSGVEQEIVLEVFETGQNMDTSDNTKIYGPIDVNKVYEIGDGKITKVTVYHYNGDVTQNVIDIEANDPEHPEDDNPDRITDANRVYHVKLRENPVTPEDVYDAYVDYGIKKLEYSDDCVIEFYDELPTLVNVYAKDDDDNVLSVVITDALGYTYRLEDGSQDLITYAWVD